MFSGSRLHRAGGGCSQSAAENAAEALATRSRSGVDRRTPISDTSRSLAMNCSSGGVAAVRARAAPTGRPATGAAPTWWPSWRRSSGSIPCARACADYRSWRCTAPAAKRAPSRPTRTPGSADELGLDPSEAPQHGKAIPSSTTRRRHRHQQIPGRRLCTAPHSRMVQTTACATCSEMNARDATALPCVWGRLTADVRRSAQDRHRPSAMPLPRRNSAARPRVAASSELTLLRACWPPCSSVAAARFVVRRRGDNGRLRHTSVVREDDALQALRAALALRDDLTAGGRTCP